tara:strand:+ start:9190 stop:9807 length:618 start_codon:yes stop_codon:yes gene_type:complete
METKICTSIYNNGKGIILSALLVVASQLSVALDYPEAGDFSQGGKVWSENCSRCHNMRNPTDLRDGITSIFHMRVRAGLTGQETRDLLTFLRGVNTKSTHTRLSTEVLMTEVAEVKSTISGERVYKNNCMACHGADGKGSFSGVPDFTSADGRLSKSDSELLSNVINGFQSEGSLMPMPPRGGNSQLSDEDLMAALEYIKNTFAD